MISDSFGYALVTAGVGMGIVFFFLLFLSVVMLVLRAVMIEKSPEPTAAGSESSEPEVSGGADEVDAAGIPRWAMAAVVAYLEAEEAEYAPRAEGWLARQ
ncbi:Oxaloacetate decarboxylase, gamma chain [Alkalispirochaeta americana]|uniref:Oxaloacetate decarboxylase, gamma chain n=1 Tax=Alkalispirochaeta americana TaxID=159291 RepID=A0A1N6Y9E0_9SPIO|nr:OadG family protein [Alkalispirochaeta americana]SIR11198.1 Oxaloacetate decarboxylase, gamma chain [Alkalispirochaeta americana]